MRENSQAVVVLSCEREYYNSPYPKWQNHQKWLKCRDHFVSTSKDFDVPYVNVLNNAKRHYVHIAVDAEVLCGSPRIAGTRIPVSGVLDAVQHHGNIEGARISYPQLSTEQVRDAVRFSAEVLEHPIEYEPKGTD